MYAKHQQIAAQRRMGLRPLDPSLHDDHFIMVAVFYAGGSVPWTPFPNAKLVMPRSDGASPFYGERATGRRSARQSRCCP